jgi:hypothetical protein
VLLEQGALELRELAVETQGRPLPSALTASVLKRKLSASHVESDDS